MIIPEPKKMTNHGGTTAVAPLYCGCAPEMRAVSQVCDTLFDTSMTRGEGGFVISRDDAFPPEAYRIRVTEGKCEIFAGGDSGIYRAFASVFQLAAKHSTTPCGNTDEKSGEVFLSLPLCEIDDKPDCRWRGLMVDLARTWHPVSSLYRYVELCFLLKISILQLHFTDDESFTLPLDCYPTLATENRHYTKTELQALCEYADALGVTIVPEVDMPGHCEQFCKKYPDVFGSHGIMSACEKTFSALAAIYSELAQMFPSSPYIHAGGDEAILGRWTDCGDTAAYMKEHGIDDIVDLYGHYVGRVTDHILSLGKTPIVWEGFHAKSNHYISRKVVVVGWESLYQIAPELYENGFTIINCSWKPLYIVTPWTKWEPDEILDWDTRTWMHFNEQSPAFKAPLHVPDDADVLGGQLCSWGDYTKKYASPKTAVSEEYALVKPRLAALSERTWNESRSPCKKAFGEALAKLGL